MDDHLISCLRSRATGHTPGCCSDPSSPVRAPSSARPKSSPSLFGFGFGFGFVRVRVRVWGFGFGFGFGWANPHFSRFAGAMDAAPDKI